MVMSLIFLLAIVSVILLCFQRRIAALSTLAALVLVLGAAGTGLVARSALVALQEPYRVNQVPSWTDRNAIVLLGFNTERVGGDQIEPGLFAYGRIAKAAQSYRDCKKLAQHCTLIVSGGDPRHHGATEADIYSKALQAQGVSAEDLLLENKSNNTWQNAQFTAALLAQNGFGAHDTVVLVTSGIHLRRSMLYFTSFGVTAQPLRADYASMEVSWLPLASNLMLTDAVLHEVFGIWRTRLYTRLGWNAPKPSAGVA